MPFEIKRTVYTDSSRAFYIPPTSKSDFVNLLHTQVDNFTGTYVVLEDWYVQYDEGYEPTYVRATYYPIDWKSKVGNSDMSDNFKAGYEGVVLKKGDIVQSEDGNPMMLNWKVSKHINNQASQAIMCNAYLNIERHKAEETDEYGYVIEPEEWRCIVDEMPASITPYAGRPDYATSNNTPGIIADSLYTCQVQLNRQTRELRINDQFTYGGMRYRIVNIDWSETDIEQQYGVLNLNMRRVSGGEAEDEW